MRLKEYEVIILIGCSLVSAVWLLAGFYLLVQWPVWHIPSPDPGDNIRLLLFFPTALALLAASSWTDVGAATLASPWIIFGLVGMLPGLATGLAIVWRTRT